MTISYKTDIVPLFTTMDNPGESATRLVAVDDLAASQVTVVEKTPHGALAVGISEAAIRGIQPLPPPARLAGRGPRHGGRMPGMPVARLAL